MASHSRPAAYSTASSYTRNRHSMNSTDPFIQQQIFFRHQTEVGSRSFLAGDGSLTLSDFNGSDAQTEGSGSQESQISAGGLDRRFTEEAASFAAMEVESDHRSPPGAATRKSTSSSDSQFDSQNSQSQSSQDPLMVDSPPQSLIKLWSHPTNIEPGSKPSMPPSQDEEMLLLSPRQRHLQGSAVASSSWATSSSSGMLQAHADDADDESDLGEGGSLSRPDYTKRNEKKRHPIKTTILDTRGRHRRGNSQFQCPVCGRKNFANEKTLSRHRGAFKMYPACLDINAAPLTVYRCCMEVRGMCTYRDHRRDNVISHQATNHPDVPIADRNNVLTIDYERAVLKALRDAAA